MSSYGFQLEDSSGILLLEDASILLLEEQDAAVIHGTDPALLMETGDHVLAEDEYYILLDGDQYANVTSTVRSGGFGWYPPKLVRAAKSKKGLKDLHADDVQELYETLVEQRGSAPKAAKKAVQAATIDPAPVVPRRDAEAPLEPIVDWDAVSEDAVAVRALLQAYRDMLDEQDALAALLLAI